MWLRAQEKHAFRLTSRFLSTRTHYVLLFITNRGGLYRENELHASALHAGTLPSSTWFCKVLPLICLLFFKSFYEIIIATCLQQGKLVFCLSVPHFFCAIFCRLLLNTTTFGASQSCEQFVTNHFSFAASYFCRSMSHSSPQAWRPCTVCIWSSWVQSNVRVCGTFPFVFDCSRK